LLTLPALPTSPGTAPEVQQLNPTLGTTFSVEDEVARLQLWPLTAAATVMGLGIAVVVTRLRRLELAAARHAGLSGTAVALQVAIETIMWATAAVAMMLPALWWVAAHFSPGSALGAFEPAARATTLAASAAVTGAAAQAAMTREKFLFRYFKAR